MLLLSPAIFAQLQQLQEDQLLDFSQRYFHAGEEKYHRFHELMKKKSGRYIENIKRHGVICTNQLHQFTKVSK